MRRFVLPLVVVLLVLAAGWLALGGGATHAVETGAASVTRANSSAAAGERAPGPRSERGEARPVRRAAARAEREALRRRILDALEGRGRAEARAARADADAGPGEVRRPAGDGEAAAADEAAPVGPLVDRTGEHGYLMKVSNEELMPLAAECEALARATRPDLTGMLVLDFEILADEELGGVVEAVVPGQLNEVDDPTLLECMRESILSITLPAPPQGGRDAISLSIPLDPPAPA